MMGVASKAANYQRLLLKYFMALPQDKKRLVAMINSPHEAESWAGCEIVLRLEDAVHRALVTPTEKAFTEWNQVECNKFVCHHMGWLTEAQNRNTLVKTIGKGLQLTNANRYVTVRKLTPEIAAGLL